MVKYKNLRIKSLRDNKQQTKTYEDWSKYLGQKPNSLGVVARMYTDNTLNFLTDGLRNIFYKDTKADKFQLSNSMLIEWQVESNQIRHVEIVEFPDSTDPGQEFTMTFAENYFQKYDIFRIDETRQQLQVMSRPIRRADNMWEVTVRIIDNDYSSTLDTTNLVKGESTATFQSVATVELSEEGYSKFQSSFELH